MTTPWRGEPDGFAYGEYFYREYVNWKATGYRLPTNAEWQKAAQGGNGRHKYPTGDTISYEVANYVSGYYPHPGPANPVYAVGGFPYTSPVGSFLSNGYGLYDMAGNVAEWCWDLATPRPWNYDLADNIYDPHGPISLDTEDGSVVVHGGSWDDYQNCCETSICQCYDPGSRVDHVGFRCVLPVQQ